MPGNSQRKGAVRRKGKGNTAGSGGRVRRGLEGKGPTPKAEDRPYHVAHRAKKTSALGRGSRPSAPRTGRPGSGPEWVVGRNAVLEAMDVERKSARETLRLDLMALRYRDLKQFVASLTDPHVEPEGFPAPACHPAAEEAARQIRRGFKKWRAGIRRIPLGIKRTTIRSSPRRFARRWVRRVSRPCACQPFAKSQRLRGALRADH